MASTFWHIRWSLFIFALLIQVTESWTANSSNHMLNLKQHLFHNYDGLVRPVKDGISPTFVTYRMLLYALLDMDTRNQRFKITTWVKMTWTDEFLTWNASEFGGISVLHVPAETVWRPDITLHQNVDETFERYKPHTYVNIFPDGFIAWYVPTIFGSSCRQRVRYFPFDTQVCPMRLSSWAYDGTHIELQAETGADAEQSRFLDNGVWEFVSVKTEREVIVYPCCPTPYYELIYTIIFRRNSAFYIAYLILPCVFLAGLSLLVFYLPPDCGEKLTLSITNLLALVVFQQLIAETMPPSGDESPMIGTFFLIMIVMVCISVVATVFVIHVGYKATKMPRWVEKVFIDCIGKCVCMDDVRQAADKRNQCYTNRALTLDVPSHGGQNDQHTYDKFHLPGSTNVYFTNGVTKPEGAMQNPSKGPEFSELTQINQNLLSMRKEIDLKSEVEELLGKWRLVSMIVDRCLMLMFTIFAVIVTVVTTTYVIVMSEKEFKEITNEQGQD